jgi:hypothetical protein
MMNLHEFTVTVADEDKWLLSVRAPFDIKIQIVLATVRVPALTEDEARSRITAYFSASDQED